MALVGESVSNFLPMPRRFIAFFVFFLTVSVPVFAEDATLLKSADAAFEAGNYTAALLPYQQARNALQGQRADWLKVTVKLIRTHNALGQMDQAVAEYFNYCLNDPNEPPLDCLPLPWFLPPSVSTGLPRGESLARDVLDPVKTPVPGPAATLLAAAVLATGADSRQRARGQQVLRELVASLDSLQVDESKQKTSPENRAIHHRIQVGLLAMTFLWKQSLPTMRGPAELPRMQRILARIDEPNRAGPLFLYGIAAAQVGDRENAIIAWMRIPILYPEHKVLAVQSLKNAADALDHLGRADQARGLSREAEK